MTANEVQQIRAVLVSAKMVDANASDDVVVQTHLAALQAPDSAAYKQALQAAGVSTGLSWLTIIGLVGGAVALYFVWQHYQDEQTHEFERPEPLGRHQVRGLTQALGALQVGGSGRSACGRMGRLGAGKSSYEFEPERRLEGYRRRAPARRK